MRFSFNFCIIVYGALIGKQKGRNIEIMNSFELKFEIVDDEVIINRDYYNVKEEQYKQVFSDLDFLGEYKIYKINEVHTKIGWYRSGWYTTTMDNPNPTEKHVRIHKQICQINECPIMMLLDPNTRNMNVSYIKTFLLLFLSMIFKLQHLPISIYESVIDAVQGDAVMLFVLLNYTLATEEAERIGVDHVARMAANETDENSAVAEFLLAQHNAIKMLHSRVKIVLAYVKAVENGALPANQEILREAYSLSQRLPVIQNPNFREEFYTVSTEVECFIHFTMIFFILAIK